MIELKQVNKSVGASLIFQLVKESTHLYCRRPRFDSWVRKIHWRKDRLPTPVSLPGESHEQRNLVGYSPWGRKESETTEQLSTCTCLKLKSRLLREFAGRVAYFFICAHLSLPHVGWPPLK